MPRRLLVSRYTVPGTAMLGPSLVAAHTQTQSYLVYRDNR